MYDLKLFKGFFESFEVSFRRPRTCQLPSSICHLGKSQITDAGPVCFAVCVCEDCGVRGRGTLAAVSYGDCEFYMRVRGERRLMAPNHLIAGISEQCAENPVRIRPGQARETTG